MVVQDVIWLISLIGIGLVALGFIYVIIQAGKSSDTHQIKRIHRTSRTLRAWLFVTLLVLFVGVGYASLHRFPIPLQHQPLKTTQVVSVVGHQWFWQLSTNRITVGVPVEFRVTSADVNHGFAIYAPDGRIVTQVQAMPGYTNKLLYTFETPGTYVIACLEYCGLAHQVMATQLNVVASAGGDTQ